MKDSLNYYYNLNIIDLEKWDSIYYFTLNNIEYYFVPLKRSEEELKDLINVSQEMQRRNIPVHELIPNKYGKLITNIYNINYCLLKTFQNNLEEYDIPLMLNFSNNLILNSTKSSLYRLSWSKLWSDKVDYFEYQISELGKDKTLILNSFSYYIGLAENAISYLNSAISKYKPTLNDKVCLSHRRINFPNYKLNYLNPLSFIFDYQIRDIAEFLKSAFFKEEDALSYLSEALKLTNYSIFSLSLLYARLLYPTYYFDLYDSIMNDEESEEILIPIIEKNKEYEQFLKKAHTLISEYAPIEPIEWLLKIDL